ncbi:MAG: hypothetical protein IPP17_25545 [Bacteroidetes bacterium]|nr:hypothetical protein [Bacteroidota bacterium]
MALPESVLSSWSQTKPIHTKFSYGYTIIGREVAQGAYYFDNDTDREWALSTWNSVGVN